MGIMDAADADVAEIGLLMTGGTHGGPCAGARGERGCRVTAVTRRDRRAVGLPWTVRLEPRLTTSRWLSPALDRGRAGRRAR